MARELREPECDHDLPAATIGKLQMNAPPILVSPMKKSSKIHVDGEI